MAKLFDKVLNFVGWDTEEGEEMEEEELQEGYYEEENEERKRFSLGSANKKHQGKVVNIHSSSQFRVVVIQPQDFDDAQDICDHLKNKKPVIVNLELLEKESARRVVDFFCGAVYALDGSIYKVSGSIFLIAPHNVDVMGNFNNNADSDYVFPWMK
ncbi:MAG: cell division protein SepF [Clostridiaceae bacterium]|nr:cell division protein SepF [Clostridiaceae bacterium]